MNQATLMAQCPVDVVVGRLRINVDLNALRTVRDLCEYLGIDLRGSDGQPYCCGNLMRVKGGLIGPDFAKCETCGKAIGNAASPHISGGIPTDKWLREHGDATWIRLDA